MYYFINQIKKKDCAFASLKILLANVYKKKDFLYVIQDKDDKSYSLKEIINEAKKYGVVLKGYKLENDEEIYNFKKQPYLITINENDLLHMVVLLKVTKKYVIIADPNDEIKKIKISELLKIWTRDFLEIEEVTGSDFKMDKVKDKSQKYVIFSLITKMISFVSLAFGLYSCNKKISFFIPLSFFLIFAIVSLLDKVILIKGMRNFDSEVITPSYLESKKQMQSTMISMNNYKRITFSGPLKLFESIFILVFATIILGYNSYLNLINISLILLLQVALFFIFNSYFKSKKRYISLLENKLVSLNLNDDEIKSTINEVNKEAYNLAILFDVKKYVGLFVSVILAMLIYGFNQTSGLNFIIFHAAFYYLIFDYIDKVINYGDEVNEYKKYKCIYLNIINRNKTIEQNN